MSTPLNQDKQIESIICLAREHGFTLEADKLNINESGMDFLTTFAISQKDNSKWVVRIPRRADVVPRLHYERVVLELVKSHLPVTVPDWQVVTDQFVAYPLLEGTPAGTIDQELGDYRWYIDPKSPPQAYLNSVAKTLVALHSISHAEVQKTSIRMESADQVRQSMAKNMEKTRALLGVPETRWTRWQEWIAHDRLWPQHSVFVHGDFHPGHTLVTEDGELTAVIDWTEAAVNDPAKDFVVFYAAFGEGTLERILGYYREAGGIVWPFMKEHIIERWNTNPVDYALFALLTGNEEHLEGARASLAWTE